MATVTKATRGAVAGNGWTSPANAVSDNAVYATCAPAKNAHVLGDWDFDAFTGAEIPAGSRITQVRLRFQYKVSTTGSITDATFTNVKGGVTDASTNDATKPTADKDVTVTFLTTPTEAELKTAGLIVARADAHRGNTTTAATFSLDYIELQVDWAPVDTGPITQTLQPLGQSAHGGATARATGAPVLPGLGQAATAVVSMHGVASSTLPALAEGATGAVSSPGISGAAAQVIPALGQAARASAVSHGGAASGLQPLTTRAAAVATVKAYASGALGALAQAGTGTLEVAGDGMAVAPTLVSLAAGAITTTPQAVSGAMAAVLPAHLSTMAGAVTEACAETIREAVRCLIRLPAEVGAEIGIVSEQYVALVRGRDVVLTREQLSGIVHPNLPADLDAHAQWTLSGDSTLTPL